MNQKEKSGQFVNDLLRTEFHKCVRLLSGVSWSDCHLENSWQSLSRYVFTLLNVQHEACLFFFTVIHDLVYSE